VDERLGTDAEVVYDDLSFGQLAEVMDEDAAKDIEESMRRDTVTTSTAQLGQGAS